MHRGEGWVYAGRAGNYSTAHGKGKLITHYKCVVPQLKAV